MNVFGDRWLVDYLINLGFSKSLSEWLGTNLKKSGEHETWAFDLDGIIQMFDSYRYIVSKVKIVNLLLQSKLK